MQARRARYRHSLVWPPDSRWPSRNNEFIMKRQVALSSFQTNRISFSKSQVYVAFVLIATLLIAHNFNQAPVAQAANNQANSNQSPINANNSNVLELVRQTTNNKDPQLQDQIQKKFVKLGNNTLRTFNNFHSNQLHNIRHNNQTSDPSPSTKLSEIHQNQKKEAKMCIGTSNRMSGQHNKTDHYQNLADRYRNCTYVIGNLEITWLAKGSDNKNVDLTFLESIREITGYLLIAYVEVEKIRMPSLQIIRGRDLFKLNNQKDEFAIFLIENEIKSLELPNLREILAGSVGFYNNRNLCHIRTINWDEILNSASYRPVFAYNQSQPECPACDPSCQDGSCWGEGPDMCQKFSKTICQPQCSQGRCFGSGPRECCHLFCAGSCSGPKPTDCLACRNFYDNGECIQECPSMMRYNSNKFLWEANPDGKYAYGASCVKECPDHLLRDNGACVRTCPPNKRSINGECVPCGGPCPKNCQGVDVVHSGNIDQLINCTVIEGSITILDTSFTGYYDINSNNTFGTRYKPLHPSRLDAFRTIREITGYLNIQASHHDFKNLSCFRNLQTIGGRQTTDMFYSLSIIRTSLVELNLHSLRKVRSGGILIEENRDLCFGNTIDWLQLNITRREDFTTRNNADSSKCRQLGLHCHEQCSKDGCWGSGPDECLSCINYKLDEYCVENCTSIRSDGFLSYDAGNKICKKCHPECKTGCTGTEAKHCKECRNVKDGPYCVAECPSHKYNKNGICEECDKSCIEGCTGPSNRLGEGGCNSCAKAIMNSTNPAFVGHCIKNEEPCPEGFYQEYVGPQSDGPSKSSPTKSFCKKCHHRCKSCQGMGTHVSVCECAKYAAGEQCEDFCPRDYFANDQSRRCEKCSPECNGCFGPTEADCVTCRIYRIYYDSYTPYVSAQVNSQGNKIGFDSSKQQIKFNCTAKCPAEKPHRISESNMLDPYCSEVPGTDSWISENPRIVPFGSTSILFMLIISAAIMFCVSVYRCQIEKDKTVKLTMHLSGIDDVEPLNPSNLKPNLAPLRSIKETELRKGNILGEGFGGTVYQGLWYPEGQEHKKHRPVAIKVLHDNGSPNMNKEFLEEAYIMASVNHPNLVRLLAVCMTPNHLMLVTPLMPLGCLLEHVKKYKNDIGSKNLLEWCKQIAKGMAYLEEHRMVHRDLALRNVLLQTSGKALISDFGLAKFLEVDQSEYQLRPDGDRCLPIKWLAPECFVEQKFTHKSDVWAFGVTIWELLTFGMKPFEEYKNQDVRSAILEGARLKQPNYMSAEVYKVLFACWFYCPDQRPNFKILSENFVNFARDPARYLALNTKGIEYSSRREMNRNSDSDELGSDGSDLHSYTEEESQPPKSAHILDLTPSAHTRSNEAFAFDQRHHSESDGSHSQHQSTPALTFATHNHLLNEASKASVMDMNNNTLASSSIMNLNAGSAGSVHHTVSTISLGHRSEQPTDYDDYLLPSPTTLGSQFKRFLPSHESTKSSPRELPPAPTFARDRDPPHSAGLIGISNREYFLTPITGNYVNSNGPHGPTNASSGHIPNSFPNSLV